MMVDDENGTDANENCLLHVPASAWCHDGGTCLGCFVLGEVFAHRTALVETSDIGGGSRIWAFTHVMAGARIGSDCNIGDHCFVESGAVIGNRVTIKNGNMIWEGVTLEDGVFVGHQVHFTNDLYPRSPRLPEAATRYENKSS